MHRCSLKIYRIIEIKQNKDQKIQHSHRVIEKESKVRIQKLKRSKSLRKIQNHRKKKISKIQNDYYFYRNETKQVKTITRTKSGRQRCYQSHCSRRPYNSKICTPPDLRLACRPLAGWLRCGGVTQRKSEYGSKLVSFRMAGWWPCDVSLTSTTTVQELKHLCHIHKKIKIKKIHLMQLNKKSLSTKRKSLYCVS